MTSYINDPPVVAGKDFSVTAGVSVDANTIFSATDSNGDTITRYMLWDSDSSSDSGYFTIGGIRQSALQEITISSSQLSSLRWIGGSRSQSDIGWVRAADSYEWGEWDSFTAVTTGFTNVKPVVTGRNTGVAAGVSAQARTLLTVSDADNDTITAYRFWDSTATTRSGYFTLDGVKQGAGKVISVSANELSKLSWFGGSLAGTDTVWAQAFDGKEWSNWSSWTMTTTSSINFKPVVDGFQTSVLSGVSLDISSFFKVTDPESDSISAYQFWDSSASARSGYVSVNGVKQNANAVIDVSASQLSNVSWIGGSQAGSEYLYIRARDSAGNWSDWESATAVTMGFTNNKPVATGRSTTVVSGLSVSVESLVNVSDRDGDTITAYKLWDSGSDSRSGYFRVNGEARSANQTISLSASEFASTEWVAGSVNGSDTVWIQVNDGKEWSDWTSWNMTTTRSSSGFGGGMAGAASDYDLTSQQRNSAWLASAA